MATCLINHLYVPAASEAEALAYLPPCALKTPANLIAASLR
jgi:hypothetical protein